MPSKTYDNFSAGHYGNLDPAKAPEGSFSGRNVLVYRDGTLGPRPGFRAHNFGRVPTARVQGFTHMENGEWPLVYVEGTNAYRAKAPDAVNPTDVRLVGSVGPTPTEHQITIYDAGLDLGGGYIHVPEGKSYRLTALQTDVGGGVLTALTAATNSKGAGCVYGERLFVVGEALQASTIFYSGAANDATWAAADFFKVGLSKTLAFIGSHRGYMTIGTNDGKWYVLSGTPATGTLRRITDPSAAPAILVAPACAVGGNNLYFIAPQGTTPSIFDGVKVTELTHLQMTRPHVPYGQDIRIGPSQAHDLVRAIMVMPESPFLYVKAGNGRAMLLNHGAWTRHDFDVALDRDWAADGRGRIYAFEQWTGTPGQRMFVTDISLERPAYTTDLFASPGDDSNVPIDAQASLPQFHQPGGTEVRVRQVIVDIYKWNTGAAEANQLDVAIDTFGRRGLAGVSTATRSWTEAGALTPPSVDGIRGTPDRIVLDYPATTPGGGFQVRFPVMRGVGIRSVEVIYDEYPGRPRR